MRHFFSLTALAVVACHSLPAQSVPAPQATDLAKATQNPIGDMVTIPLQFNFTTGGALGGQTLYNMNFQPVLPLPLGQRWNVIARTIVPYLNIPTAAARTTGTGDIVEQLFFVPTSASPVTVGFGPVFSLPTATNTAAQTGDWAMGPGIVVVRTTGAWVIGGLATQLWTIAAGENHESINQLGLQPFINYNLAGGWSLGFSPALSADFTINSGQQWTVPLGLGVSKVTAIGTQPLSVGVQYYHYVVHPVSSGSSLVRLSASFLYPKPAPKG